VTALHAAGWALTWLGAAVTVLASVGVATVRDLYDRLHFVAGASTVGGPLVVLGLALQQTEWRAGLKFAVIALVIVATGPATTTATARAQARRSGDG
jgi:multicomponent Na+:H+ antiporter subunit G